MNKTFFHRTSNRKPGYNYADEGYYFITIVVHNRELHLGKIIDSTIQLSESGQIANDCWLELFNGSALLSSQAFVIMANHIHGILQAVGSDSVDRDVGPLSVGEAIRRFKAKTCVLIRENGVSDFKWQRNYYDHIIRSDRSLRLIQLYIATNHILWSIDAKNPEATRNLRLETTLMQDCGFNDEDISLLRSYVEYRVDRKNRAR